MAQKRLERCFSHAPCADSNLPAGNPKGILTHRRVGGVVVGIERFVMAACADLACLTSQMCLGETTFERSQESIRSTARPVRCPALQHSAGRGRSGAGAWRRGQGIGPSAAGDNIVLHTWSVCTRGPRG